MFDFLDCISRPIIPSVVVGGIFTAITTKVSPHLAPQLFGTNCAILYSYSALQCPMEALHGRQSSLHNAVAGGTIGYFGVERRVMSVPFEAALDENIFRKLPQRVSTPVRGAIVYGCGAWFLAGVLSGKPI